MRGVVTVQQFVPSIRIWFVRYCSPICYARAYAWNGSGTMLQCKIVTARRRNIQSGAVIGIRLGLLIPENVLEMVCSEWTAILPLCVTNPVPFANSDPMILTDGLSR